MVAGSRCRSNRCENLQFKVTADVKKVELLLGLVYIVGAWTAAYMVALVTRRRHILLVNFIPRQFHYNHKE